MAVLRRDSLVARADGFNMGGRSREHASRSHLQWNVVGKVRSKEPLGSQCTNVCYLQNGVSIHFVLIEQSRPEIPHKDK